MGQDAVFWISVDLKKSAVMVLSARKQTVFWCLKAFLSSKVVLEKTPHLTGRN